MNENLHISEEGLRFIANFEGCYLTAYDDLQPKKKLVKGDKIKGTLTIGYGHIEGVYIGQTITQKEAWEMFKNDMAKDYELRVKRQLKVEVNQLMFDALVSRAYNVGNVVNVAKALNEKNYDLALKLMEKPNTSKGIVLNGLTKRRNAEKEMLRKGINQLLNPVVTRDEVLEKAVSKIIKSGINIDFNSWKRADLIKIKNVPSLLIKFANTKDYPSAVEALVEKGVISSKETWMKHKYSVANVISLIKKFASIL